MTDKTDSRLPSKDDELAILKKELEFRDKQLNLIKEVAQEIVTELDFDKLINSISRKAQLLVEADSLVVPILNKQSTHYTYKAACGKNAERMIKQSFPVSVGMCGWVLSNERPLLFSKESEWLMDEKTIWEDGMESALLVPLKSRGKIVGGLSALGKKDGGSFTQQDFELLSLFSSHISVAIDNAQIFEELNDRKKHIETTLNSIGDAVITTDKEGRVQKINPVASKLLACEEGEIQGQLLSDVFEIVNLTSREPVENPVEKVMRTGKVMGLSNHTVLIAKDGVEYQISDSAAPICDAQGKIQGVVLVFRDVTEECMLQAALKEKQQQLQSILDNTPAVIYVKDLDGRYLLVNRQFENLFNTSNDKIRGLTDYDIFPNDLAGKFRENDVHVIKLQAPLKTEEVAPHKDGLHTYISVKFPMFNKEKVVTAICGISTDITERMQVEESLRVSQKRLNYAQHMAHIGSWELDLTNNKLEWSDEIYHIFEIDPAKFSPSYEGFLQAIHPDDRERVSKAFQESLKNKTPYNIEHRLRMKDGTVKHVIERCKTYYDEAGKPLYSAGIVQDITERTTMEAALRRSQKMEVIGQLSGGIAHDFNNQLGVIIGYLDFLKKYFPTDKKPRRWVDTASKATLRCMDLTRQLLSFSRRQSEEKVTVNVNACLHDMESMIIRSVTPEVDVQLFLLDDLWLAEFNSGEFQDTILNMVINARDAMPKGGKFLIETTNKHVDVSYSMINPEAKVGDYVQLMISDTGIGMDKATLDHVFEPFFSTKPVGKGTGLGMAMVYGFVKRYGGFINVYSESDVGTTFRIYLPRSAASEPSALEANMNEADLPTGSESILIVDDETDLLQLADQYLSDLGYHTHLAENGAQALAVLAGDQAIDLLFSDVVMPGGMNGYELAQLATQQQPDLKVLLTSGFTSKTTAHNGLAKFAAHLLDKPYRKDDLALRVRSLFDDALDSDELA